MGLSECEGPWGCVLVAFDMEILANFPGDMQNINQPQVDSSVKLNVGPLG